MPISSTTDRVRETIPKAALSKTLPLPISPGEESRGSTIREGGNDDSDLDSDTDIAMREKLKSVQGSHIQSISQPLDRESAVQAMTKSLNGNSNNIGPESEGVGEKDKKKSDNASITLSPRVKVKAVLTDRDFPTPSLTNNTTGETNTNTQTNTGGKYTPIVNPALNMSLSMMTTLHENVKKELSLLRRVLKTYRISKYTDADEDDIDELMEGTSSPNKAGNSNNNGKKKKLPKTVVSRVGETRQLLIQVCVKWIRLGRKMLLDTSSMPIDVNGKDSTNGIDKDVIKVLQGIYQCAKRCLSEYTNTGLSPSTTALLGGSNKHISTSSPSSNGIPTIGYYEQSCREIYALVTTVGGGSSLLGTSASVMNKSGSRDSLRITLKPNNKVNNTNILGVEQNERDTPILLTTNLEAAAMVFVVALLQRILNKYSEDEDFASVLVSDCIDMCV